MTIPKSLTSTRISHVSHHHQIDNYGNKRSVFATIVVNKITSELTVMPKLIINDWAINIKIPIIDFKLQITGQIKTSSSTNNILLAATGYISTPTIPNTATKLNSNIWKSKIENHLHSTKLAIGNGSKHA
ncbi:hypothetical protein G9A89_002770 [Geosiphon pyriformis]|nr:hypothetical protein G9A89_002770 [Geosiphon pyriformis]